jgi:GT2 family glycosyltransferase
VDHHRHRHPDRDLIGDAMDVRASVVMPAFNAGRTIDAQLEALCAQQVPGTLEVIVADNGSTDDTSTRVRNWMERVPSIRFVDASERRGAAHARNRGFAVATSAFVLGCDADDVVDGAWAARLLEGLADADLVAGGTVSWPAADTADQPPPVGGRRPYDMKVSGLGFYPVVIGSSFGVHRDVWKAVGGFDETLPQAEDFDFAFRVQLAGYRFASRPDAFVHYRVPTSTIGAMRKYYGYGRFQPLLYRKHRGNGMRRRSTAEVAKVWLRLLKRSPELVRSSEERRHWCERFAHASGRIAGSAEFRIGFL